MAFLSLLYAAEMNGTEIVNLNLEDVDLAQHVLTSHQKGRKVEYSLNTLSDRIRFWLQARGKEDGPLFVAVDKVGKLGQERLNPQVVHDVLTRRAKEVGMEGVSIAAIRDLAQRQRTELTSFGWRDRDDQGRIVCLPV